MLRLPEVLVKGNSLRFTSGNTTMSWSSRLPLSSLIELCRALRHNLGAGLPLLDVFRQQARRGPAPVRPIAERIADKLKVGDDLETALEAEKARFPPMFVSLVVVGEQTGNLPEVFRELEKYFTFQQKLHRQFWAAAAWPLLQFFAAIFVIAGMLLLLGIIAEMHPGTEPFDPLGLGLLGVRGAAIFLSIVFGGLLLLGGVWFLLTRLLRQGKLVDGVLLKVPALGPCMRALALQRFCLALRLTMETGMSIAKAVRLSLRATANEAFAGAAPDLKASLSEGHDLSAALATTRLFPEDFINILANAEEGGRMTEVLEHQTEHYQDEASRKMSAMTWVASALVWVVVAIFIIFVIFRVAMTYLGMIDQALQGI
jgi:type IV pilus assembly protein PilC